MTQPCIPSSDVALFYNIWFSILRFVNEKKKMYSDVNLERPLPTNLNPSKEISDAICDDPSLLDEYLAATPDLSPEVQEIVKGFKRFVRGTFMAERHLQSGTILIDQSYENAYLVKGLVSSLKEMLPLPVPCMIETVLLPFKNVIITYGYISTYNMFLGPGIKRNLKEAYSEIKDSQGVTKSL